MIRNEPNLDTSHPQIQLLIHMVVAVQLLLDPALEFRNACSGRDDLQPS